jgi:hypothetical protein
VKLLDCAEGDVRDRPQTANTGHWTHWIRCLLAVIRSAR